MRGRVAPSMQRVFAIKACLAKLLVIAAREALAQALNREIRERIGFDIAANLIEIHLVANQLLLIGRIHAIIA